MHGYRYRFLVATVIDVRSRFYQRVLRAPEASAVRRMCCRAATDHHGHLAKVKVELLAPTYCHKIYPPLKLRVFVGDITALVMGRNKEVAKMAKKVMKRLREEVEKKQPQIVS